MKIKGLANSEMDGLTKNVIHTPLTTMRQRVNLRSSKQLLVEQLQKFRNHLSANRVQLPPDSNQNTPEQPADIMQEVVSSLRRTSLQTWIMKPLVATRGMKEGTVIEKLVLTALPDFISKQHLVLI